MNEKTEYLIEHKKLNGMVIGFEGFSICYCTNENRISFEKEKTAADWMKANGISEKDYFVAEHVFHY